MLDAFVVFTKGGVLLWTLQALGSSGKSSSSLDAINALISTCLLEERSASRTFLYTPRGGGGGTQALKWAYHNARAGGGRGSGTCAHCDAELMLLVGFLCRVWGLSLWLPISRHCHCSMLTSC